MAEEVAKSGQQSMDMKMLFFNFLIAFGGWLAAIWFKESASRMIGFFDIQNSDGVAVYKAKFTGSEEVKVENAIFLLVDVIHHSIVSYGYSTIAFAAANLPLLLVYGSLNPEEMMKWLEDAKM